MKNGAEGYQRVKCFINPRRTCVSWRAESQLAPVNCTIEFSAEYVIVVNQNVNFQINPYPTAFPYGNGMVLHLYQQQESSTTKTVHKVINKGLKTYV